MVVTLQKRTHAAGLGKKIIGSNLARFRDDPSYKPQLQTQKKKTDSDQRDDDNVLITIDKLFIMVEIA